MRVSRKVSYSVGRSREHRIGRLREHRIGRSREHTDDATTCGFSVLLHESFPEESLAGSRLFLNPKKSFVVRAFARTQDWAFARTQDWAFARTHR